MKQVEKDKDLLMQSHITKVIRLRNSNKHDTLSITLKGLGL